jgi:prepilin-type N-terminal cleavage/methylation domain-containing protein
MNRRGSSLVEMLLVIAVSGVVMALVAGLIGAMLHAQATARQAARRSSELARLSLRFRTDAHSAAGASAEGRTPSGAASRLTLAMGGDRSIEFSATGGRVDRIRKEGETIVHRDSFVLSGDRDDLAASIDFENAATERAAIVVRLRAAVDPSGAAGQVSRLEAQVGRDRKLQGERAP